MSFHKHDMWGKIVLPGEAYQSFKRNKSEYHPAYTWRQRCAAFRKRIRKNKIAKESRRWNRRK